MQFEMLFNFVAIEIYFWNNPFCEDMVEISCMTVWAEREFCKHVNGMLNECLSSSFSNNVIQLPTSEYFIVQIRFYESWCASKW